MTPEKLKEIEAKAQELYPTQRRGEFESDSDWIESMQIVFEQRNAYKSGALSRQPELDTLQKENDLLKKRVMNI